MMRCMPEVTVQRLQLSGTTRHHAVQHIMPQQLQRAVNNGPSARAWAAYRTVTDLINS